MIGAFAGRWKRHRFFQAKRGIVMREVRRIRHAGDGDRIHSGLKSPRGKNLTNLTNTRRSTPDTVRRSNPRYRCSFTRTQRFPNYVS